MRFSRRQLFKLFAAGWLLRFSVPLPAAVTAEDYTNLAPLLDTLMPADETPSATDLKVDQKIRDKAQKDPNYARMLRAGCRLLDTASKQFHRSPFHEIDSVQREHIITLLSRLPRKHFGRRFLDYLQDDVFTFYYSQPQSWAGLPISGPPQPHGYPDHAKPPTAANG